jgi:hypothetical protein
MIQMDSQVAFASVPQESLLNSMTSPASNSPSQPQDSLETKTPFHEAGMTAAESISEIKAYGNSEIPPNPITYCLKISGLERQDLKKRMFEIFSEARLNFRSDTLVKSINNGVLELNGLNPVKVSVLIARLRELPVELTWTQGIYEVPIDTNLTKIPVRKPGGS